MNEVTFCFVILYLVIKYLQIKRNDKNWIKKMMLKETQELTD